MDYKEVLYPDYEVNPKTLALRAAKTVEYGTRVYEEDGVYLTEKSPIELIEDACLQGGSTYEGRRQATVHHLNYVQSTPVVLNPYWNIFALPSESPENLECVWVMFQHIRWARSVTKTSSGIHFLNGLFLDVPVSVDRMQKQIERTGMWKSHYSNR